MMSSSLSDDDRGECGLCGWGQTSKMCTSCEQKVEQANANEDDDKLFQDPPPKEDCEICFLPMLYSASGDTRLYQPCCGKVLCKGCMETSAEEMRQGNMKRWCPYCRIPMPSTGEECMKRLKKRMKLNDAEAIYQMGLLCKGSNRNKAITMWKQAVELGSINGHNELACAYHSGQGVEEDNEKAMYHWKLAAIGGHEKARHNLGIIEYNIGNFSQAMKHFIIAARSGYEKSLEEVGEGYKARLVTKDEYASTLRAYQHSMDEMISEQRTKAAVITKVQLEEINAVKMRLGIED